MPAIGRLDFTPQIELKAPVYLKLKRVKRRSTFQIQTCAYSIDFQFTKLIDRILSKKKITLAHRYKQTYRKER